MTEFQEFLTGRGISDPELLIKFLEEFGENPEILFGLSDHERGRIEMQIDTVLEEIVGHTSKGKGI